MKRVMVAAMLLLVTGSVFATEVKVDREKVKQEVQQEKTVDKASAVVLTEECTITLDGWIGLPFLGIRVSCQGTATTCKRAAALVAKCVKETIKAVEEEIKRED